MLHETLTQLDEEGGPISVGIIRSWNLLNPDHRSDLSH